MGNNLEKARTLNKKLNYFIKINGKIKANDLSQEQTNEIIEIINSLKKLKDEIEVSWKPLDDSNQINEWNEQALKILNDALGEDHE
jgi:hypothetical protein